MKRKISQSAFPSKPCELTPALLQGTCVFWMSVFQYITLVVIYSKSYPYRKPIYNNRRLTVAIAVLLAVSVWWLLAPPAAIATWLELLMPPVVEVREYAPVLISLRRPQTCGGSCSGRLDSSPAMKVRELCSSSGC